MPESQSRRLAAILAADIAGYSALMGADEARTVSDLKGHQAVVLPLVGEFGGRIIDTAGDGILAEFPSVVNAVKCAVTIQTTMAERNAAIEPGRRMQFRVGINLGDVVCDEARIYGDGINVAARLEGIAEPGGICISNKVYEEISGRIDLACQDIGDQQLKNIARPVRAYRVRIDHIAPTAASALASSDKPSVAVLPFENMSGDPEQEYFSDGLSEDIITLLSAWRSFPVIARNSSFAFKKQSRDIRTIGRELSARYVIEGSVRKSSNRVRVTAQLIDAESGHHLWARKFDGALDDVFALQDEITRQIVISVEPEMEKAELRKSETKRSANLDAWDYFLRGRAFLHQLTPEGVVQARAMFERAIELDRQYSDACAGLSWTYQREILFEVVEDRRAWEDKALEAARRAVALDNGSSFAHLALSGAFMWSNQHEQSISETRMAVELNPSNVPAWLALGNRLDIVGEHEEGIPLLEKSLQLNPHDPHNHIYYAQLGRAYINARKYEIALRHLRESIRLKPDYANSYHVLAICLGHLGRVDEARAAAQRCEQLRPGLMRRRAHWNIYVDPEANRHLTEGLCKAGLLE
jgi:adenylate cyclase